LGAAVRLVEFKFPDGATLLVNPEHVTLLVSVSDGKETQIHCTGARIATVAQPIQFVKAQLLVEV
jgi:hypothetical protein